MQQGSSVVVIDLSDGTVIKAKTMIGCDGVHSRWLGLAAPVNSRRWAVCGIAVFPQAHGFRIITHVGVKAGFIPLTEKMAGYPQLMQKQVIENCQGLPSIAGRYRKA
ncbi:hypothetical protein QYF36_006311 [Acer negundo]|nr:hypothetical protein QYF36_006311 [Acer negundo]